MLDSLRSNLHTDAYNIYWVGALVLTVVLSALSVFFSHVQQYRQHPGWRLAGDLFVREQLAFLSYGLGLFISAYFGADQRALGVWFAVLGGSGIAWYGFGLWLTKPDNLRPLHKDAKCPAELSEPCPHRLRFGVKFQSVILPFIFFLLSLAFASLLAFEVTDPKLMLGDQPGNLAPMTLAISDVRTGAEAYRDAATFIRDNLAKLEQEQASAGRPEKEDAVIAVIESEGLQRYGHFCWKISLMGDYPQKNFGLSARAAYMVSSQGTFRELNFSGTGNPFTALSVSVPESQNGNRILVPVAIFSRFPGNKVYENVSEMLRAEVQCQ
jgi:hypothetical protein